MGHSVIIRSYGQNKHDAVELSMSGDHSVIKMIAPCSDCLTYAKR
jgi:hypothetical protein